MNRNTLIGLVVAALIVLVAAIFLVRSQQPREESRAATAGWLAPTLHERVNEVDRLTIRGAGDQALVELARGEGGWSVAQRAGYPADTGKLRELLLKLADAKELEEKTASPEKYAQLGVEDVTGAAAKGVELEFGGLPQPLKLIVGNPAPHGGGTYARRAGEAPSWLVSGSISVARGPADWLRKDLANLPAERIASVRIEPSEGPAIAVRKVARGDANFHLLDLPKGREAGPDYGINGLAAALADLQLEDVAPAAEAAPPEHPLQARYTSFDGLVVDVVAWQDGDKHWLRLEASLDEALANAAIEAEQAEAKAEFEASEAAAAAQAKDGAKPAASPAAPLAVSDPAKDRAQRIAALDQEVAEFSARFKGWSFQVPAWKYSAIDKKLDDLLKPREVAPAGKQR